MEMLPTPSETPLPAPAEEAETRMPERRRGRPPKNAPKIVPSEEALRMFIARVAAGETLAEIAKEPGSPTAATARYWIGKSPELQRLWHEAKVDRAHSYFDRAVLLANRLESGDVVKKSESAAYASAAVRAAQVAIEAYRVAAERLDPREYGPKTEAKIVVPIQIVSSLGLDPANPHIEVSSVYTIEAVKK